MDRRSFLAAGSAAAASLATPAIAQRRVWTMPEEFKPRVVTLQGELPANEIHVDPKTFALYWTLPEGKAIRYTCGVGRGDLYESGTFRMGAKKEWPSWTPTPDMIEREPAKYEQWKDGRPGGPGNPLGARALYLFTRGGRDTFLRIHGTTAPWTINSAVSNGCVRLTNAHIAHLYQQVPLGVKVVLHPKR
ncbi:MAG: L,D-transpeptidase [Pseudomonadota bacterium]